MIVCIVDAISTGNLIAPIFKNSGYNCIHLKSRTTYSEEIDATFHSSDFSENITHDGNLDKTLSLLRNLNVRYVIPGSELAVEIAESLATNLGLEVSNHSNSTHLRRNKFFMHDALSRAGLAHAKQVRASNAQQCIAWMKTNALEKIVLKPEASSCSDGVVICENDQEIIKYFNCIHHSINRLGGINEHVLCQQYLEGVQYFVNAVTYKGQHYITDVWEQKRSRNTEGAFFFEAMMLADPNEAHITELSSYCRSALSTLDVQFGATHNEIILTNSGPILVECNARLMGASIDSKAINKAIEKTQPEILVQSYTNPSDFLYQFGEGIYKKIGNIAEVSFLFKTTGILSEFVKEKEIVALPSFSHFSGLKQIGQHVVKTVDTFGEPGYAYLVNDNPQQLVYDLSQILEWQKNNEIFKIT